MGFDKLNTNARVSRAKTILAMKEKPPSRGSVSPSQYPQMVRNYDARNALRDKGRELVAMGEKPLQDRQLSDLAPGFRADLSEFWRYEVATINWFLEALKDSASRQKKLKKLVDQTGPLTDALHAWAKARRVSPLSWKGLEDALVNVQIQLETLRPEIDSQYPSSRELREPPVEGLLVQVIDAIGREVACQAADHLGTTGVDLGGRYTGAAFAAAQASATRLLSATARQAVMATKPKSTKSKKGGSSSAPDRLTSTVLDYLKNQFNLVVEATRKSGGQPWVTAKGMTITSWLDDLMGIGDEWAKYVYDWDKNPGDVDDLVLETDTLIRKLSEANSAITAVTPTPPAGSLRMAQRALDALALAVADRLDEIGQSDDAVAKKLDGPVKQLRAMTANRPPAATVPLSSFWQQQKSSASSATSSSDWSKYSRKWLTGGLAEALDKWSSLLDAAPHHDPDELYDYSWAIAENLLRYRFSVSFLKNEEARQVLLDAIEGLADKFSSQLTEAQTKWGSQL